MVIAMYIHFHLPPGPVRLAIIKNLGLNQPLYIQYLYFLWNLVHGNLGYTGTALFVGPVSTAMELYFPNTIQLVLVSFILSMILGILISTAAAVRKDSWADKLSRVISFVGISLPIFWLAYIVMIYIGIPLRLPIYGSISTSITVPWIINGISSPTHIMILDAIIHGNLIVFANAFEHVILPLATLTFASLAGIMRYMRNSLVETMKSDYVKFARAKGINESLVIKKYARKNALIPVVSVSGLLLAGLLGGVVVIEDIYNYPGIGLWTFDAILSFDGGGIIGVTLLFALTIIIANLVIDIIRAYLDPRIRVGD
jgi:peptide/nickel transport system permease protein